MLALFDTIPTLDRVFDDVMKDAWNGFATAARFRPAVDVRVSHTEIVFVLDVPGVKADDLEVTVENSVLRVRGARRPDTKENEKISLGRAYGEFALAYTLPDTIDGDKLAAYLADGVLTIRVPKHPKAQPRKIQIGRNGSNQLGP